MRTTLTLDPDVVPKLAPGIDPDRMNALVDQLEDEAFLKKRRRETTAFVRSRAAERPA